MRTWMVLVLVFGSPWYADWADDNTNPDTAGGWWLRLLSWPRWQFDSEDSLREIILMLFFSRKNEHKDLTAEGGRILRGETKPSRRLSQRRDHLGEFESTLSS